MFLLLFPSALLPVHPKRLILVRRDAVSVITPSNLSDIASDHDHDGNSATEFEIISDTVSEIGSSPPSPSQSDGPNSNFRFDVEDPARAVDLGYDQLFLSCVCNLVGGRNCMLQSDPHHDMSRRPR